MHKMVDISTETWNKAEVSVIKIHKNDMYIKQFYYCFVFLRQKKMGR